MRAFIIVREYCTRRTTAGSRSDRDRHMIDITPLELFSLTVSFAENRFEQFAVVDTVEPEYSHSPRKLG